MNRRGPSARIAPVVDHREEDSSSGRVLPHARQPQQAASVILEMIPALSSALSVEARRCRISLTPQSRRRIRPSDSHASSPPRSVLAHDATRARGEGPDPVPGHHRSLKGPILTSPPAWTWSRSWRYRAPRWSARPCRSPGARSSQAAKPPLQALPWCRAASRPSAPVMFTCPAPALLKQAIHSPSRTQLVDYIPTTSRRPVVIISSSHQCQSFHKSSHKPMNRLAAVHRRRPHHPGPRRPGGPLPLGR